MCILFKYKINPSSKAQTWKHQPLKTATNISTIPPPPPPSF